MIMGTYSGVILVLFSIWIMKFLAQGSFNVKDLTVQKCRIAGITLISHPKKLNFSDAESACRQLGLQLASKTQVEKAWNHGFETCSFGWVSDKWLVISRVTPNPKCGQNKTGVADWKVPISHRYHCFCFNSSGNEESPFILMAKLPLARALITKVFGKSSFRCSLTFQLQCVESLKGHSEKSTTLCHLSSYFVNENASSASHLGLILRTVHIWIDSCIPETGTTLLSATDPEVNSSSTASSQGITEMPTATESPKPQISRKTFRIKCVTETILPTVQTILESEEEMAVPNGNQAAFTNDSVVFGGVPIALLVLALIFFVASAVLAVCYIKKYKRTRPFSNKKPQKERIEAKVIKDAKSIDNAPEKESKNNGKKAEEPQTKPEATVKCVEAEV